MIRAAMPLKIEPAKKFYPAESSERLESLVKMILCPPVSIRAADILTRNLLAEYSPIVLASVLPGSGESQFVRAVILDLKHPLKHEVVDKTASQAIEWTAKEQLNVCLDQIKKGRYLKPEELLAPTQREENSVGYCPRCRCQFVVSEGECPDCPGVALGSPVHGFCTRPTKSSSTLPNSMYFAPFIPVSEPSTSMPVWYAV